MRLFSRAFCALPLVAALFATPALAVDFFFNTTHFQAHGKLGEADSAAYYFGSVAPDGTVSFSITSTNLVGGGYVVQYSGAWSDVASAQLTYDGVRHGDYFKPDGSLDYSQNDPLQGSFDLIALGPLLPGYLGDAVVPIVVPWNIVERYGDGGLKYLEESTMKFRLDLTFNAGAAGKTFAFGVSPIPEPSTWALMITGFGLAGAALRRSRRQVVAA